MKTKLEVKFFITIDGPALPPDSELADEVIDNIEHEIVNAVYDIAVESDDGKEWDVTDIEMRGCTRQ